MGDVGDGHPQSARSLRFHQAHRIVEILRIGRVDGHEREVTQVGATLADGAITVDFGQAVSVVHQGGVVVPRKRVVADFSTAFEPSVEQATHRPLAAFKQQQRHGGLVVPEPKPGPHHGAALGFTDQVEALPRRDPFLVEADVRRPRLVHEQGSPGLQKPSVGGRIGLGAVFFGQGRPPLQGGTSSPAVSAEEILPSAHVTLNGVDGGRRAKANGLALVGDDVATGFSSHGQGFVDLAQQGAFGLGVASMLGGQPFLFNDERHEILRGPRSQPVAFLEALRDTAPQALVVGRLGALLLVASVALSIRSSATATAASTTAHGRTCVQRVMKATLVRVQSPRSRIASKAVRCSADNSPVGARENSSVKSPPR